MVFSSRDEGDAGPTPTESYFPNVIFAPASPMRNLPRATFLKLNIRACVPDEESRGLLRLGRWRELRPCLRLDRRLLRACATCKSPRSRRDECRDHAEMKSVCAPPPRWTTGLTSRSTPNEGRAQDSRSHAYPREEMHEIILIISVMYEFINSV